MRGWLKSAVTLLLISSVVMAGSAFAAKGGNKPSASAISPSITLDQTNPAYGETVTFTVTYAPMRETALVWLNCWQDGVQVHQFGGLPTEQFGLWNANPWHGGAANCEAELYYFVYQGKTQTDRISLATTRFDVSA